MEKIREEFEQWWQQEGYDNQLSNIQCVMFNRIKRGMFAAWQASRASIVVELPTEIVADMGWSTFRAFRADKIKSVLRSIGLSIKGE
jgi:hypothetical protein